MLVGQQLGPFLIEKEIGAGAMGAVYKGKYLKTGQVVAIKIMAPGSANPGHAARFERESAVLKQMNHPNIVRLFGAGKHQGMPYFAMEFVQGESLDKVMARRERMSWEEVVDLGRQLCAALQHAHEKGVVHRDLKPSNLMILPDGTLKLTDFGIAKDLDVTSLTAANCTLGTAAYMSPEQCKGDRNLDGKSDLYSLGVVLYELITGKKPFTAENAMDMFMQHVTGKFERPSRVVLDVPPWLDTLICQLLEKKPDLRPRDAGMVAESLAQVQEKVEAQQSAGIDAVRSRLDRPRSQRHADEEDREAARALLAKKGRRGAGGGGKKKKGMPTWLIGLQAAGLLLALAGVGVVLYLVMRPPSPDKLYQRAEKLWETGDPDKQRAAREGPIKEYLARYADRDDEKTRQIKQWQREYDVREFETLMDRYVKRETTGSGVKLSGKTDGENLAFAAALAEHEGDREKALRSWEQAKELEGRSRVGLTADEHLPRLRKGGQLDATEKSFRDRKAAIQETRTEPVLGDDYERRAFLAWRQEDLGDRAGAREAFEKLRESAGKERRYWALYAAVKAFELRRSLEKEPQAKEARKKLIEGKVKAGQAEFEAKQGRLLAIRAPLHEVATVYEGDADFAPAAKQAKDVVAKIDEKLPRK
jgi:serine/threonine-protein kinase